MPLAVIDSKSIAALRTAAATAVATKYLARALDAALICGCGGQAPAQLRALLRVPPSSRGYAYDQDAGTAKNVSGEPPKPLWR